MAARNRLPSWADARGWKQAFAALPGAVRPPEPLAVQEEWRRLEGFDVHVDRWLAPGARAKILMLHGPAGHGRLMGALAWRLALFGFEVICPDLPGYGLTRGRARGSIRYDDWREVAAGLVEEERARGGSLFLYGASLGGMLAYDTAVLTGQIDGLIASALLDPTSRDVRRLVARRPWRAGLMQSALAATPRLFNGWAISQALAGDARRVTNHPPLTQAILDDKLAGGAKLPVGFVKSWLASPPLAPPESFDACPVLMVHPGEDRWSPIALSDAFYDRLAVLKRRVVLKGAGHFPVEAPGADQHDQGIAEFCGALIENRPVRADLI